jgi:hypothetical protein
MIACSVILLAGCSSQPGKMKEVDPIIVHLQSINQAYIKSIEKQGRPPKNVAEIRPALQEVGDPDKLLRSPIDGEEFVIIWGVDPRTVPPQGGKLPVLIYEKKGVAGKRYVLQVPTLVSTMTEEELRNAYFPAGHKFSP